HSDGLEGMVPRCFTPFGELWRSQAPPPRRLLTPTQRQGRAHPAHSAQVKGLPDAPGLAGPDLHVGILNRCGLTPLLLPALPGSRLSQVVPMVQVVALKRRKKVGS